LRRARSRPGPAAWIGYRPRVLTSRFEGLLGWAICHYPRVPSACAPERDL